jgi:hypothetical protein
MNQNATSMPISSCWISEISWVRQFSKEGSQSLSAAWARVAPAHDAMTMAQEISE